MRNSMNFNQTEEELREGFDSFRKKVDADVRSDLNKKTYWILWKAACAWQSTQIFKWLMKNIREFISKEKISPNKN